MDRKELKNLINGNGNFRKRPLQVRKLDDYLEEKFIEIYKTAKLKPPIFSIYTTDEPGTAHYLYSKLYLEIYRDEQGKKTGGYSRQFTIGMHELFGNCGIVCLNNLSSSYYDDVNDEYLEIMMQLAEDVVDLFGYSSIIYTTSNTQNIKLIPILDKTYKKIHEFKNKRMTTEITIYSKDI